MAENVEQNPQIEGQNSNHPHRFLQALGHGFELCHDNTGKIIISFGGAAAVSLGTGIAYQSQPAMALVYIFTGAAAISAAIRTL